MQKYKFKFKNKVVLITGASRGLGFEISKAFLLSGANLIICSRSNCDIKKAFIKLTDIKKNDQEIIYFSMDISSENKVKNLIKKSIDKFKKIDVLINNAAIIGPKGIINEVSWKDWKRTIDINLFGSIFLIKELLPFFKKQNKGKIIQLSGGGATSTFPMLSSYAVSKVGIVRFIENLSEELKDYKIDMNSVAPGIMNTDMIKNMLKAGENKIGKENYKKFLKANKDNNTNYQITCQLIMFLSSNYSNGIRGKIISSYWDNWQDWPRYKKLLQNSDLYTIRRIVGRHVSFKKGDRSNT